MLRLSAKEEGLQHRKVRLDMAWRVFVATFVLLVGGCVLGSGSLAPEISAQAAPAQAPAIRGDLLVKFKDGTTPSRRERDSRSGQGPA